MPLHLRARQVKKHKGAPVPTGNPFQQAQERMDQARGQGEPDQRWRSMAPQHGVSSSLSRPASGRMHRPWRHRLGAGRDDGRRAPIAAPARDAAP